MRQLIIPPGVNLRRKVDPEQARLMGALIEVTAAIAARDAANDAARAADVEEQTAIMAALRAQNPSRFTLRELAAWADVSPQTVHTRIKNVR